MFHSIRNLFKTGVWAALLLILGVLMVSGCGGGRITGGRVGWSCRGSYCVPKKNIPITPVAAVYETTDDNDENASGPIALAERADIGEVGDMEQIVASAK